MRHAVFYAPRASRVLFAGLHPLIREDSPLQAGKEYEMHTTSAHQGTLLQSIDRLRPNVILLDLLQTDSLRTGQRARDTSPSCRDVALTGMRRADIAESIFSIGASGVLSRSAVPSELVVAIRTVWFDQQYLVAHSHEVALGGGGRTLPIVPSAVADVDKGTCHHFSLRVLVKDRE